MVILNYESLGSTLIQHRSWYIKSFEREWWKISILLQNNVALNLSWNINMSVGRHELAD
ncbi:hypothetical protein ACE6H2_014318 [Prunus campanulata]